MKKALLFVFALLISSSVMFAQAPVVKKGKVVEPKTTTTTTTTTTTQTGAPVVKTTPVKAAKPAKGYKVVTGDIVNLLSAVTTAKAPILTKEDAVGMAARGELLALKSGTKLYLVVMADGINASKKMADKAGAKLTLTGKVKAKGGISMLIIDGF